MIFTLFLMGIILLFSAFANPTDAGAVRNRSKERSKTILDYYGFFTNEQKESFVWFLKKANIAWKNNVIKGHFSAANVMEIVELVKKTQKQWVCRKPGQERWDVVKSDNTPGHKKMLFRCLKILGVVHKTVPFKFSSDAVCVLGAAGPTMQKRLKFLEDCIKQNRLKKQKIILLSGERSLKKEVDGPECIALMGKKGVSCANELLEPDLLLHLYNASELAKRKWPMIPINGSKGVLPRATTETTLQTLLQWLKQDPSI